MYAGKKWSCKCAKYRAHPACNKTNRDPIQTKEQADYTKKWPENENQIEKT